MSETGETYSQSATQPLDSEDETFEAMEEEDDDIERTGDDWGRLYPAQENVKFHKLTKKETKVGKLNSCDVCLKNDELPASVLAVVSRHHFSIVRTEVLKCEAMVSVVHLHDCSMNGTFINGTLVGNGNIKKLQDNNVISVGKPENKVFHVKIGDYNYNRYPRQVREKYDVGIRLGTGAYGEVSLVFDRGSGKAFAMKSILKKSIVDQKRLNTELMRFQNEIKILRVIKHPNVIQLLDDIDCETEKFLILEIMRGKDLYCRISDNKRLTEPQSKLYFYQIASGLQYLHSVGIIHRDLKPENVLLATDDVDTLVKISDFGLSKVVDSQTYLRSRCGTKMYVAPEILRSGGREKYTGQVDIWSMGVILYVCLSGSSPFSIDKHGKTMDEQILTADYDFPSDRWECVSMYAKALVKKMMALDPVRRINVENIFSDLWLQDSEMLTKVDCLVRQDSRIKDKVDRLVQPYLDSSRDKENIPSDSNDPPSPRPAVLQASNRKQPQVQ